MTIFTQELPAVEEEGPAAQLQNAEILVSEGMLEEAKRTLRSILRDNPDHVASRKLMKDVHERELDEIFSQHSARNVVKEPTVFEEDIDHLVTVLDRELKLDLDVPLFHQSREDTKAGVEFGRKLKVLTSDLSLEDKTDTAIAFMEMGFFRDALDQVETISDEDLEGEEANKYLVSIAGLSAICWIRLKKDYEAKRVLEEVIVRNDVAESNKIDLYYLLGRVHEKIDKTDVAAQCYEVVIQMDALYRDAQDRLNCRVK